MALQDYSRLVGFIDGNQVVQLESLSYEIDGGQQEVVLLNEGLAGFTPGGGMVTVNFTGFVPVGGFEDDFPAYVDDGDYHTVQIGVGPKAYVGNGKFKTCKLSQSTNGVAQIEATWVGERKKLS